MVNTHGSDKKLHRAGPGPFLRGRDPFEVTQFDVVPDDLHIPFRRGDEPQQGQTLLRCIVSHQRRILILTSHQGLIWRRAISASAAVFGSVASTATARWHLNTPSPVLVMYYWRAVEDAGLLRTTMHCTFHDPAKLTTVLSGLAESLTQSSEFAKRTFSLASK